MPQASLAPWQFAAINNPFQHFAMFGGVATGKTFTGCHFVVKMLRQAPHLTGFIGANTYDQLSQATLRELFYWLEYYKFDFVVDCRPPLSWGGSRQLKTYKNTMHVRNPWTGSVTLIFTRVLGEGNPLRGIEFSWYWLDETRDTPQETHDIVLSRMRESNIIKGIITTTTNGEDWTQKRFCFSRDGMYGSMHVATQRSVECGIITHQYYNTMRRSYSPLMAQQELDALHVNVKGGRAYYAAGAQNKLHIAPWGEADPTRERPLVIGCDFNFNPAPCVWMVGQVGPNIYNSKGMLMADCIHWFGEIALNEASSRQMAQALLARYPGFFYEIYGDVSGGVGTTSNAGETDYNQIGEELTLANAAYTIDYYMNETRINPKVRNRVENMNAMFFNAVGEVRQTYNPEACPLFDGDIRTVGWKPTVNAGRGKLDDGGDNQRTHATDGGGYAVWKKFPPGRSFEIVESVESSIRAESGLIVQR